jgi:flagellar protein FliT
MLEATREQKLDELVEAEARRSELIARLRDLETGSQPNADLMRRKMVFIRKILADDAQIRELTQPWLVTLERLLGGVSNEKNLRRIYG